MLLPNGNGTFHIDMQTTNTLDYSYIPWSLDANAMDYQNGKLAFAYEGYNRKTGLRDAVDYEMVILDERGLQFWQSINAVCKTFEKITTLAVNLCGYYLIIHLKLHGNKQTRIRWIDCVSGFFIIM